MCFSKIWELPDGFYCHFLQKRSTNLAFFKGILQKAKLALLLFYWVALTRFCMLDRKERILLNMYLRISLRNIEEFSGSPKTAKIPHILIDQLKNSKKLDRSWTILTIRNELIATFFKIASDFFQPFGKLKLIASDFFQPFGKLKFYSWWNPPV